MSADDYSPPSQPILDLARFPALARLRLEPGDFALLAEQGFVGPERRAHVHQKLRFRRGGRQIVRYVGDHAAARAVQLELDELQAERRLLRRVARLDRDGRRLLRETVAQLEPLVRAAGFRLHGRNFRQPHRIKPR